MVRTMSSSSMKIKQLQNSSKVLWRSYNRPTYQSNVAIKYTHNRKRTDSFLWNRRPACGRSYERCNAVKLIYYCNKWVWFICSNDSWFQFNWPSDIYIIIYKTSNMLPSYIISCMFVGNLILWLLICRYYGCHRRGQTGATCPSVDDR